MRPLAIRAASIVLFAAIVLAAPPMPPALWREACVVWKPLWEPLGFLLNCDSFLFLDLAANPAELFEARGRIWQSRPMYVLFGAGLTAPIERLFPGLNWPELLASRAPSWWAYVIVNFAILLLAVGLFDALIGAGRRLTTAGFVFGSWLIANDVVRFFVWTPHTQLFNVLVPVVALAASRYGLAQQRIGIPRAALLGFVLGIGALAYGSFLVPCAAFLVSSWLRGLVRDERSAPATLLAQTAATGFAFALPIAAWLAYVRLRTGGFYSHEVQDYRQFVWLYDAWRAGWGTLASAVGENLAFFLPILARILWLPITALGALLIFAWWAGASFDRAARERKAALVSVAVVTGLTLVFLALLGFYADRLTWALVPPILVACVVVGDALEASLGPSARRSFRAVLALSLVIGIVTELQSPVRPLVPGSPVEARAWAARALPPDDPVHAAGASDAARRERDVP